MILHKKTVHFWAELSSILKAYPSDSHLESKQAPTRQTNKEDVALEHKKIKGWTNFWMSHIPLLLSDGAECKIL